MYPSEPPCPGDTVGCGWDLWQGLIFFTRNGEPLGVAFVDAPSVRRRLREHFTPTVVVVTPSEGLSLQPNFGETEFLFCLRDYRRTLFPSMGRAGPYDARPVPMPIAIHSTALSSATQRHRHYQAYAPPPSPLARKVETHTEGMAPRGLTRSRWWP